MAITDEKRAKIITRLDAGDSIKKIALEEKVGRATVRKVGRESGLLPMPSPNPQPEVRAAEKSPCASVEIAFKRYQPYRCDGGHRTCYKPCPVCIALRANAELSLAQRQFDSQATLDF